MKRPLILASLIATSAIVLLPSTGHAVLTVFENFDALNNGALNGQNGWVSAVATNATVAVDSGADKVANLAAVGASGNLANYKALNSLAIVNSSVAATVYFNFTISAITPTTGINNWNFIITDVTAPTDTAASSEVQFNIDSSQFYTGSSTTFRVNDGGTFRFLTTVANSTADAIPLVADSQYNVWFAINNSTDIYNVYLQNSSIPALAAGPTQVFTTTATATTTAGDYRFRNSTIAAGIQPNNLITVNMGSASASGGSVVRFDDIYVDLAGTNLTNPVPEPSVLALGLVGVAGAGLWRRRRA